MRNALDNIKSHLVVIAAGSVADVDQRLGIQLHNIIGRNNTHIRSNGELTSFSHEKWGEIVQKMTASVDVQHQHFITHNQTTLNIAIPDGTSPHLTAEFQKIAKALKASANFPIIYSEAQCQTTRSRRIVLSCGNLPSAINTFLEKELAGKLRREIASLGLLGAMSTERGVSFVVDCTIIVGHAFANLPKLAGPNEVIRILNWLREVKGTLNDGQRNQATESQVGFLN